MGVVVLSCIVNDRLDVTDAEILPPAVQMKTAIKSALTQGNILFLGDVGDFLRA